MGEQKEPATQGVTPPEQLKSSDFAEIIRAVGNSPIKLAALIVLVCGYIFGIIVLLATNHENAILILTIGLMIPFLAVALGATYLMTRKQRSKRK